MASKVKKTKLTNDEMKQMAMENEKKLLDPKAKSQNAVFVERFFIDFDEIDLNNLFSFAPSPQGEEGAMASQDMYKYEKDGKTSDEVFTFRGPPIISRYGITAKENEKTGTKSYAIYSTLDVHRDEKQKKFADFLDKLFERKAEIFESHRVKFGMPKFSAAAIDSTGVNRYVKYPKDENTQEEFRDRNPYFGSKLIPWFKQRTMFVGIDKKAIPWAQLMNVEMCFVPLYTCGYHKGGMGLSFPMKMKEAVVLYYRKVDNNSSQEKTIDEYRDQYMEEYRRGLLTIENALNSEKSEKTDEKEHEEKDEEESGGTLGKVGEPENQFDKFDKFDKIDKIDKIDKKGSADEEEYEKEEKTPSPKERPKRVLK